MKKKMLTLFMAITLASSMCMTSFGYDRLDTEAGKQNWRWEDWDDDGVYECYYYKDNGNRGFNLGRTPDGYDLNEAGQWVVNGVVQTRTKEESTQETVEETTQQVHIDYSAYDPEHPLANVVDAWNLRLPNDVLGAQEVSSASVQALLTNQMDYYNYLDIANHAPLVDGLYTATRNGTTFNIREEDYNDARKYENDLYNWYCDWLNGMDFENMSEMERAKEIQKVLGACHYDQNGFDNSSPFRYDYSVLINKTGVCEEFAMTACSLAKALGLKSAVGGSGIHAVYSIQVDGKAYGGQNQILDLNNVMNDVYYWN